MSDEVEIIDSYNLGDEYYYDDRCLFKYKGKTFGVIDSGSFSGYYPWSLDADYVSEEDFSKWLHGENDWIREYDPDKEWLKELAEKVIANGAYHKEDEDE